MKKLHLKIFVLAAIILGSQSAAHAVSAKKAYCNNQDYYTSDGSNNGKIYPHLHCLTTGLTFSASGSNHKNFLNGEQFNAGQANGACTIANIGQIKAVIKKVCENYDAICSDCN